MSLRSPKCECDLIYEDLLLSRTHPDWDGELTFENYHGKYRGIFGAMWNLNIYAWLKKKWLQYAGN